MKAKFTVNVHCSNRLNQVNRESIFIIERLPKQDVELKRHAESLGLVTTTRNCQVGIFHRAESGNVKTFPVYFVAGANKWSATDTTFATCGRSLKSHCHCSQVSAFYNNKE